MNLSPGIVGLYCAAAAFTLALAFHAAHRAANAIAAAGCPCCEVEQ